jgi:hypothetical protein
MHSYISGGPQAATLLPPIPTPTIVGAGLANRQLDKRQRAILAADVLDGVVRLDPSQKQLAQIFGVSVPYVMIARKLSPGKRAAILRGWDPTPFTELMNPPPRQLSLAGPVIPTMKAITDIDLQNLIRTVGIERALDAAVAVEHTV